MIWKIVMTFFALGCFIDAAMAYDSFQHFGDMHMAWAANSLIAGGSFLVIGWTK